MWRRWNVSQGANQEAAAKRKEKKKTGKNKNQQAKIILLATIYVS